MRTKTAANAILYYEAGQEYVAMAALTDSGDHAKFTSPDDQWSGYEGKEPIVRPNGLLTGGVITPAASDTNNYVDVSAATAYIAGELVSVDAAADLEVARGASSHIINSIVIQDDGEGGFEFAVEAGLTSTSFNTTRGEAGAPPLIGVDDIEVGQVRYTLSSNAAVTADEIFQVPGTHQELSAFPVWDEDWAEGEIEFASALPLIHTGPAARKVYAAYYTPIYSEVPAASDFVPAEQTHSVTSTQIYGGTVGARSSTLGQGSFTARLSSGVVDNFIKNKNKNLWFKFYPDRYRDEHILSQGVLGISRQFPAGDSIIANCTISADAPSVDVES